MIRPINRIIIHSVDVKDTDTLIAEHLSQGMPEVGFHYIIAEDGATQIGRNNNIIGNHLVGYNADSIGVACIGKEVSRKQKLVIDSLLEELSIKNIDTGNVFIVKNGELKIYK